MISRLLRHARIINEISDQTAKKLAENISKNKQDIFQLLDVNDLSEQTAKKVAEKISKNKPDAVQAAEITAQANIEAAKIGANSRLKSAAMKGGITAITTVGGGLIAWNFLDPTKSKLKDTEANVNELTNKLKTYERYFFREHQKSQFRKKHIEAIKALIGTSNDKELISRLASLDKKSSEEYIELYQESDSQLELEHIENNLLANDMNNNNENDIIKQPMKK